MKKNLAMLFVLVLSVLTPVLFTSCEKEPVYSGSGYPTLAPTVNTLPVTAITSFTALSGGDAIIDNDIELGIILKGVCWSTKPNPVPIVLNPLNQYVEQKEGVIRTMDGSGTNSYISNVVDLKPNTTYYLRAYVTYFDKRWINSTGIAYGNTIIFTTP